MTWTSIILKAKGHSFLTRKNLSKLLKNASAQSAHMDTQYDSQITSKVNKWYVFSLNYRRIPLLSMVQWNICLDVKYLVSVTNVTQENRHTNEGWRRLLTNVCDTAGQLQILALKREGNWQSLWDSEEGKLHLKDTIGGKEDCRNLCSCHVALKSGMG